MCNLKLGPIVDKEKTDKRQKREKKDIIYLQKLLTACLAWFLASFWSSPPAT